jgi:hypothetical protein
MPESITLTVPDTVSLSVTSPARTGVSVLSTAPSSLTVTERGVKGDRGSDGVDGVGVPTAYTLPATDGSADQVLVTDGSGTISFAAVPGLAAEVATRSSQDSFVFASLSNAIGVNTSLANTKIANVSEDDSPQLGANLDVQARSLFTSTTDGDIQLTPNGTGSINLDGTVKFKRFSSAPAAFEGGMYADNADNLYFGVS